MRTNNRKKLIGAVAVASIVAAAGSAFTGTGVTSTAAASQFVGGTVSQTISGATLNDISYQFADPTNTTIDGVTLTFGADALGKSVAIALAGSGASTSSCVNVHGVDNEGDISGPYTSECTVTPYTGAGSIAVTVS